MNVKIETDSPEGNAMAQELGQYRFQPSTLGEVQHMVQSIAVRAEELKQALAVLPIQCSDVGSVDKAIMSELQRQHESGVKYLAGVNINELTKAVLAALTTNPKPTP